MHVDPMKSLIVEHLAGSHAYGTNIATSDVDKRGIFCAGAINIRTPFFPIREVTMQDEEDGKLYELTQFMNLYVGMNPNIVETLWVDPMHIITKHEAYDYLRANAAQQLLNKKAAFTFSGYAVAQLKRIKGHNKWINNPQEVDAPRQTRFVSLLHNFSNQKMFSVNIEDFRDGYRLIHYGGDIYGVYEAPGYQTFDDIYTLNTNSDDLTDFYTKEPTPAEQYAGTILKIPDFGTRRLPLFMVKFHRENYRQAKEVWQNYWNWKKNRNEKRSELEEQFGYDTKHAMHLVRLLRMGEEILTDGVVNVARPDAEELLDIRNGAWTYEEIVQYAEHTDHNIREVLYKTSSLPKAPDLQLAGKVLMECQDIFWETRKDE